MVRDRLGARQRAYFELSNEVWNFGFPQATQALNEGLAEKLSPDKYTNNLLRYAEKGRQQLQQLRPAVRAALAASEYNAMELRQAGFDPVRACTLLFDLHAMRAHARPPRTVGQPRLGPPWGGGGVVCPCFRRSMRTTISGTSPPSTTRG